MDTLVSKRYKYDGKIPFYFSKKRKNKIREFEEKNSLRNKDTQACYVCWWENFTKLWEKDKYWFYYPVVICHTCTLVQTNPYYSWEEVNIFYSDYFREVYMWVPRTQKYIFENNIKRGEKVINFIQKNTWLNVSSKKVLDIWCGNWWILKAFQNNSNFCLWIDLWSTYFNLWVEQWLDLRQSSLKWLLDSWYKEQFDIVVFSHNLEHLINPKEELQLLKKIIHKDSIVFISVPWLFFMENNNFDYVGEYFQNAHKSHFTLSTLQYLMKYEWYKLIHWDEEIQSIFMLGDDVQKVLTKSSDEIITRIKDVESIYVERYKKLMFIKIVYFILDKLWLRIFTLAVFRKLWITKFFRTFLLWKDVL